MSKLRANAQVFSPRAANVVGSLVPSEPDYIPKITDFHYSQCPPASYNLPIYPLRLRHNPAVQDLAGELHRLKTNYGRRASDNERLTAALDKLKSDNERLTAELAKAKADCEQATKDTARMTDAARAIYNVLSERNDRITELERQLSQHQTEPGAAVAQSERIAFLERQLYQRDYRISQLEFQASGQCFQPMVQSPVWVAPM